MTGNRISHIFEETLCKKAWERRGTGQGQTQLVMKLTMLKDSSVARLHQFSSFCLFHVSLSSVSKKTTVMYIFVLIPLSSLVLQGNL